ncbi:MAG: DPP IV N-terminal domain-containing protein [Chloroflexota bacterium]
MTPQLHRNTHTALRLVVVTLLMTAGVTALMVFAPDNADTENRIAYASFDGNDFEIFTVNPDGTERIQVTDNNIDDWGATWSPDRSQLAFRSGTDLDSAIYVMDADGTHIQRLSADNVTVGNPYYQGTMTWSPDGTQLAYSANFNGNWDIWTTRLDDGYHTRLTSTMFDETHPDWSPDGEQILFNRPDTDGELEIFVMDIDTGALKQLTDDTGMVMYPRWSPDGQQIVYFINDVYEADVYVMDADGRNHRQITSDIAVDRVGVFSPDGDSIVFRSERDGDSDIYVMNLATGDYHAITDNNTMDMAPDW